MISTLLGRLASPYTGEELFDQLTDLVYFIKNQAGQYVVVNQTLVQRCGVQDKSDLLGKTASQVLRAPLGEQFESQDHMVLRTGRPILSRLELHFYPSRDTGWCLTTKLPLRGKRKQVLGLVGVSQDLRLPDLNTSAYRQLSEALNEAEQRLENPPTVEEMAERAGMSRYQFDRRMQMAFGISTRQWLLKLRIGTAERLLRDTKESIAAIAHTVGYADQSAFARQFSRTSGLTPLAYRTTYSEEEI